MNESRGVLSFIAADKHDDLWYFAALRIKEGVFPKYLIFSASESSIDHYEAEVKEFLNSSELYFFEDKEINRVLLEKLNIKAPQLLSNVQEITMILFPLAGKYELDDLVDELDIKRPANYRSLAQLKARLTWEILKKCLNKAIELDLTFISKVIEYTEGLKLQTFFQMVSNTIIKKFPDRPIRIEWSTKNNAKNILSKPQDQDSKEFPILTEWVESCFEAGGLLSQNFMAFEHRSIQTKMAKTIIAGFSKSMDIIIEAGTGTGKTIAYLIPSLWWAKRSEEKVVIATHTITLQEQIYFKDLPSLKKILPFSFSTALLKGRSNYICLKSFKEQRNSSQQLSNKERLQQAVTLSWLRETETGDFGELTSINIFDIAKRLGCDNRLCQPGDCHYRQSCYYLEARKRADEADLVVINHSLLLADIKTKNRVLPEYQNLIIDEAHNLYPTALRQLGFELCYEQINKLMDILHCNDKGNLHSTLKSFSLAWSQAYPDEKNDLLKSILDNIPIRVFSVREQAKELFMMVDSMLAFKTNLLLDEESVDQDKVKFISLAIENLINRLGLLNNVLDRVSSSVFSESQQFDNLKYEICRYKGELLVLIEGLSEIIKKESDCRITYIEKSNTVYIKSCPFDVAPILKEEVFSKKNCTALVSATLSVADSFAFIAHDIGMENYLSIKLDSTFDYDEQMLFCIVNDLSVDEWDEEMLILKTASFINRIAQTMRGRTLVLFTSHRTLRSVHHQLQKELTYSEGNVLSQGISGNRDKILKEFMNSENTVLMGTNTFWEGIDIPGDSLRCVVIVKLPFSSPETPIIKAKSRLLAKNGGDPFYELLLPEAVIRFKQGFGRLIRTKGDRGVVVLLDDRVIKKKYGQYFIKSLPISSYFKGNAEMVINEVSKWS